MKEAHNSQLVLHPADFASYVTFDSGLWRCSSWQVFQTKVLLVCSDVLKKKKCSLAAKKKRHFHFRNIKFGQCWVWLITSVSCSRDKAFPAVFRGAFFLRHKTNQQTMEVFLTAPVMLLWPALHRRHCSVHRSGAMTSWRRRACLLFVFQLALKKREQKPSGCLGEQTEWRRSGPEGPRSCLSVSVSRVQFKPTTSETCLHSQRVVFFDLHWAPRPAEGPPDSQQNTWAL